MNGSRREFVLSLGSVLAAWPLDVAAQPPPRVFRVGVLSPGTAPPGPLDALRQGLRDLGYEDGRNISIEWRFAGASNEPLRDLAEELVRLKVDVIVAINTQASLDRKSTRLNSSHLVISYAVFCLKKKKTSYRTDRKETTYEIVKSI